MVMKARFTKSIYYLLVIIFSLKFIIGCATDTSDIDKEENKILFQKNLDLPEGSDGKIVFLEKIVLDTNLDSPSKKVKNLVDPEESG
jgi:hypothetical protein